MQFKNKTSGRERGREEENDKNKQTHIKQTNKRNTQQMEPTSKSEFIFMSSSFETQFWRTFGYVSFLQVVTGHSSRFMNIILSGQNQREKRLSWLVINKFKTQ